MAKASARKGVPPNKKPRHSATQKKAAARERADRARERARAERLTRKGDDRNRDNPEEARTMRDTRPSYRGTRDDRRVGDSQGGGYQGNRRERDDRPSGGYRGDREDRRSGGYQGNRDDRRAGGYQGNRGERDDRRTGGYQGNRGDRDDRRTGGYQGGGYQGNRGERDDRRTGGYQGNRGERDDRRTGGYQGNRGERDDRRTGGYRGNRGDRDDRRSGGYQGGGYQGNRGERDDRRSGGYQGGGYQGNRGERDDRRTGGYQGNRGDRDDRRTGGYRGDRDDRRPAREGRQSHQWASSSGPHARPANDGEGSGLHRRDRDWTPGRTTADPHQDAAAARVITPATAPAIVHDGPSFAELGVSDALVSRLSAQGFETAFPIQVATIPDALAGRDVLGKGKTGSGKTLAFGVPTLQRLAAGSSARPHKVRALVLTPTRELAMQIEVALRPLASALGVGVQLVAGGMSYQPQLQALSRGVDLLVATPGRLIDLMERGAVDLSATETVVLDEADHMAEIGFLEAVTQVLHSTPQDGQRLLFSATLDRGVDQVVAEFLTDPVLHESDPGQTVSTMTHHLFLVHPHDKRQVIAAATNRPGRTVVFARTKLGCERVATQLRESGVFAAALHGDLSQLARTRIMQAFREGVVPVLVATDVAARGIHVDDVSLVLQIDPPADHKDYLHRSGRTARAGQGGDVVTLALPHQRRKVTRLIGDAGVEVQAIEVTASDPASIAATGGAVPTGESIPDSRVEDIVRPPRPARHRRPGQGPRQNRRWNSSGAGDSRGGRGHARGRSQGR